MRTLGFFLSLLPILFACTKGEAPPEASTGAFPTLVSPTPVCAVDWKKVEAAWDAYGADPSPPNAEVLLEELRLSSRAQDRSSCAERQRVQHRFVEETAKREKLLTEAGRRGPEILDALLMHSDAGYTDELYVLLGMSAAGDPKGFLELIAKKYAERDCPYVANDPEEYNDVDPPAQVRARTRQALENRIKSLSKIREKSLVSAREACLKELREALPRYRKK